MPSSAATSAGLADSYSGYAPAGHTHSSPAVQVQDPESVTVIEAGCNGCARYSTQSRDEARHAHALRCLFRTALLAKLQPQQNTALRGMYSDSAQLR
jgi:hypothetical protein